MALSYPEGECFFERSALKAPQEDGYNANNLPDFYSNMLVEYIWNQESYHGSWNARTSEGRRHPRSSYRVVNGHLWGTDYGCWENLPFSYGPKPDDIRRRGQHDLCIWGNRFRDREKGASAESWFMQMPMPTKEERCVWIDLLGYIRAIYIPIAHQSCEQYPNLCTFIQINFAARAGNVKVWRPSKDIFLDHTCDKIYGLNRWESHAVGLDVYGLLLLLSLPRQLRTTNAYASKLISLIPSSRVKTIPVTPDCIRKNGYDLSWLQISKANFGLELHWVPHKPNGWFVEYMVNAIKFSLGFVPKYGFILQASFSLAWTAFTDLDRFMDVLKEEIPSVALTIGLIDEIKAEIKKSREYVADGWADNGQSLQVPPNQIRGDMGKDGSVDGLGATYIIAKTGKVLAKSGDVPTPPADQVDAEAGLDANPDEVDASNEALDDEVAPTDSTSVNNEAFLEKTSKAEKDAANSVDPEGWRAANFGEGNLTEGDSVEKFLRTSRGVH